jgi:hypothetical protein
MNVPTPTDQAVVNMRRRMPTMRQGGWGGHGLPC